MHLSLAVGTAPHLTAPPPDFVHEHAVCPSKERLETGHNAFAMAMLLVEESLRLATSRRKPPRREVSILATVEEQMDCDT